jgi:tetratricopeptide (TPR) repeat protein
LQRLLEAEIARFPGKAGVWVKHLTLGEEAGARAELPRIQPQRDNEHEFSNLLGWSGAYMNTITQMPDWVRIVFEIIASGIEFKGVASMEGRYYLPDETAWRIDLLEMAPALMEVIEHESGEREQCYGLIHNFDLMIAQSAFDEVVAMGIGIDNSGRHEITIEGKVVEREIVIGEFRKALSIKPDYPWAHYQLGITYTEMQRLQDAEASCTLVLKLRREELKRDGDGEQDWVLVNSLMCLGLVESFLGKYDEAIAHFRKVAELEKAMYDVRMYLGAVLKTKGDHEAAIVALKESVALQPHPNALYLLGEIYLEQSRWKEAIESYKQSLEFEDGPHISPSHHGLGIAFLRIGDRQAAMTHYQELKKLDTKRAEQLLHEINK